MEEQHLNQGNMSEETVLHYHLTFKIPPNVRAVTIQWAFQELTRTLWAINSFLQMRGGSVKITSTKFIDT